MAARADQQYSFPADLLRASAAIAVVILHLFDPVYLRPDFFGGKVWWLTHIIGMLCRSAVPLFIMLSGYLTLNRGKTLLEMWNKSVSRIVIPGLCAFSLYFVFDLLSGRVEGSLSSIIHVLFDRLNTNTASHLFFLLVLFYLYLATPFLDTLFTYTRKIQGITIASLLGITVLCLLSSELTFSGDRNIYNTYTTWIFYLGYYLFGYYARDINWTPKREKLIWVVFLAAYLIGILGSYWIYAQRSSLMLSLIPYFSNYFSLNIIVQSMALFVLLMKSKVGEKLKNFPYVFTGMKVVAANSFGLYLYHLLVMLILNLNVNVSPSGGLIPFLLLSTSAIFVTTLAIIIWLRRTSLRFLIGE